MRRVAAGKHFDKSDDFLLTGGVGFEVVEAEGQGVAILRAELGVQGFGLGMGIDGA